MRKRALPRNENTANKCSFNGIYLHGKRATADHHLIKQASLTFSYQQTTQTGVTQVSKRNLTQLIEPVYTVCVLQKFVRVNQQKEKS